MTQTDDQKTLKHNIVFNLLDGATFGFGLGFASFSTILPLFVATMTNSALLIGLIPAIHNVGWQFPQLLTAGRLRRSDRFKPWVMWMTINERLPFLGFAIIALLIPKIGTDLALILTFVLLIWQGMGAGLSANAWQNLLSKVIPAESFATFLGVQSALANLFMGISAILAGFALVKINAAYNYSFVFIAAFIGFVISWFCLNQTKEAAHVIAPQPLASDPEKLSIWKILMKDKVFRGFLLSRFISQFGMMAFSFYTIYAVKKLGMDNITIGIMTSILFITQTLANPLLGWLADKWSRKWILALGGLCNLISVILALLIHQPAWFSLPFILCGIANTAYWTIGMTIALEFGNVAEKPTYVGMSNTLIAPATILAPLLGGFLADIYNYSVTFYVAIAFSFISFLLLVYLANVKVVKSIN
ncbi:MAG: MFS transporter [Anaerolineaceae bacterium]